MDIAAMVNAYDNQLQTCFTWDNHANETEALRGRLNAIAQLYTDDEGKAEAHVHFEPSHTTIGGATWNIVPSDIFYSDKNIVIEHFSVEHALQHLTINGTVKVTLVSGYTPKIGDSFTLWTVSGTFAGNPTFDLPALPEGMAWDTTKLTDGTGVLSIIAATGIRTANAERGTLNDNAIYDVNGRLRKRLMTEKNIDNLPAGIYIRGGKKIIIK